MASCNGLIGRAGRAVLAASVVAALAVPAAAETFTFGSGVPERSAGNQKGIFPLLDKVTEATDGRVSFTRIVGGQLVSMTNTLQGIRDGVVDTGYFISQFYSTELPYSSLMAELTGLGTDPYATMGALNEAFFVACDQCREEFRGLGLVPALVQSASPLTMQCTRPVATAADLRGLKISTIGSPEARWATVLEMTPVRTNIVDILPALQLGQSDCTLVGTSWIRSYGLEDTVKGVIEMPQGVITGAFPLVLSDKAWESISEEDRKAIVGLMPEGAWDYVEDAYVEVDAEVRAALEGKIEFQPGDQAMKDLWKTYQQGEVAALKELAKQRGVENADQLIDEIVEIFRAWHEDYLPQFKGDRQKFAALLRERVFSKYDF